MQLLLLPNVLDLSTCEMVRRAMDAGTPEPSEILDSTFVLDEQVRRSTHVDVDEETMAMLARRLDAQTAAIERFFGVTIEAREGLSVLRYRAGGFFRPHRDRGEIADWPDAARREISLVLFLNSAAPTGDDDAFTGGALRLFDEDESRWREIQPQAGTLVAFPSRTLHEVSRVRDGVRDTAVDWIYLRGAGPESR
jgi:predicted 2-oxoglutarate/Fe(II)-dependent dioxygenase YbiX